MNIVIVSVLLSIAAVIVVPIGFVFGGLYGASCWPCVAADRKLTSICGVMPVEN